MTLSRPVLSSTSTAPRAVPPPVSHAVSSHSARRWDNPRLRTLLEGGGGTLGTQRLDQRFDDDHLGVIKAGDILVLPALIVVACDADVIIEQTDDGTVLTGRRGVANDCRLVFRHAYSCVSCTLRTVHGTGDVHIGFLDHRHFNEVQAISIQRPRGGRNDSRGTLWTTLEYHADPLCEVQGIAWRGGMLQIAGVTLSP